MSSTLFDRQKRGQFKFMIITFWCAQSLSIGFECSELLLLYLAYVLTWYKHQLNLNNIWYACNISIASTVLVWPFLESLLFVITELYKCGILGVFKPKIFYSRVAHWTRGIWACVWHQWHDFTYMYIYIYIH